VRQLFLRWLIKIPTLGELVILFEFIGTNNRECADSFRSRNVSAQLGGKIKKKFPNRGQNKTFEAYISIPPKEFNPWKIHSARKTKRPAGNPCKIKNGGNDTNSRTIASPRRMPKQLASKTKKEKASHASP